MLTSLSTINQSSASIVIAEVASNQDPLHKGRVQVIYRYLRGDNASVLSDWARVCLPYASKNQGFWLIPEVGDLVALFFEEGNPDLPVILGVLYSENDSIAAPVTGRPGDGNEDNKNNLKFIKTRSGHLLCFDDSDGGRGIVLKDKENRRFEIQSQDKKMLISDDQGHGVTLEASQISIQKGGSKIVIKEGTISIESAGTIELGKGAGEAVIKGDAFMQYFNTHTHSTSMGPSGPPMQPMLPTTLSQKTKTA